MVSDMGTYEQLNRYGLIYETIFFSFRKKIISPPILDPTAREGYRRLVAEVSIYNHVHFSNYDARCFDELNRGSILGPDFR
jgi:hypothetical protein